MGGQKVRFRRAGLVEEYSVSMDGVRQDFVVTERPAGSGELQVRLEVTGAKVEAMGDGARLELPQSGRKIAYNRVRATDATGRQLAARMEVLSSDDGREVLRGLHGAAVAHQPQEENGPLTPALSPSEGEKGSTRQVEGARGAVRQAERLAVMVNDAGAVYPVRIDPTFSDANWISLGGIPGANGAVYAAAVDDSGNLYIGGDFTFVGSTVVNCIAQWNGSSWSALGSGMNGSVNALAVSGGTLYAGGSFTTAGGVAANNIAQWNGSSWSALGSGMNSSVFALAVSGSTLYAGGYFTTAGGSAANYIAQWNGSSWSALGSGIGGFVYALAVSGGTLYAGGNVHDGGRQHGQLHRAMGREQLVGAGLGDEQHCVCAGGVGRHVVCGRHIHDGGRQHGQLHRAMEREQLVGTGFGDGQRGVCAGGVGQHVVCGRRVQNGGRQRGQ